VPTRSVRLLRLYRFLEIIGYWSMLDVLVVGLVTAVVQFRGVSEAEPRLGIFYFGMVVILTMLATQSFDPRLLWDRPISDRALADRPLPDRPRWGPQ
jgi:paraquat-inducible protein A